MNALNQATNSVLVQAYSFTSAPIAEALVDAHRRGVKVQVILDHSQRTEKYSEADFLKHSGIPTLIDAQHAIAHNKVMILDDAIVLTGSFNFTKAAEEHNAENLLVINDPVLAKQYIENWHAHEQHSELYEREAKPAEGKSEDRNPKSECCISRWTADSSGIRPSAFGFWMELRGTGWLERANLLAQRACASASPSCRAARPASSSCETRDRASSPRPPGWT